MLLKTAVFKKNPGSLPLLTRFFGSLCLTAALAVVPRTGESGLYTGAFNPTYNLGPESAWMNPAGMSGVKTIASTLGVGGVIPIAKFDAQFAGAGGDNGGNAGVSSVLPSLYVVAPIGDQFHLGLSVFSPLGGPDGLGWNFGDNFAGRYSSQGLTFASYGIAPSFSWKVNDKWSVGAGASAQWLNVNISTALNTPFQQGDGKVELKDLTGWSARYFFGTQFQLTPATSIGVVYRSKWSPDLEGEEIVTGLQHPRPTDPFEMDLVLPQEVEFGIQHALNETWILGLTFDWQNWTQFKNIRVEYEFINDQVESTTSDLNWHDTYSGGVSLTHIMGNGSTFVNLGLNYASSPVSDADRIILLPVDSAWTVSLGFAHNASQNLTYSLGGSVVINGDASIDQTSQGVRTVGQFDTNLAIVLGGSLQWRF